MKKFTRSIIYLLRIILTGFCIYALLPISANPKQKEFPTRYDNFTFMYFTYISIYFTLSSSFFGTLYLISGFLYEVFNFFLCISSIFNTITTISFWLVYLLDKELILNKNYLKKGYETFLFTELCFHLFPFVLSFIEHLHFEVKSRKLHVFFFFIFDAYYFFAIHGFYFYLKAFPYPFLKGIGYLGRIGFFFGFWIFSIIFYEIMLKFNKKLHAKNRRIQRK